MRASDLTTSFLERYGAALSEGDLDTVAACWEVPAFVVSDHGVIPVQNEDDIRNFFRSAVESYRSQGLDSVRSIASGAEWLTPRIVSLDVRWSALDRDGAERHQEHSNYLLRIDDAGEPRIRVAVTIMDPEDEEDLVRPPAWAEGL